MPAFRGDPSRAAITHSFVMLPRTVRWGAIDVTLGVADHVPIPAEKNPCNRKQLDSLPCVAEFARSGSIQLYTTIELELESWGLKDKTGRNAAKSDGFDLFAGLTFKKVSCPVERPLIWSFRRSATYETKQAFLQGIRHPRFVELRAAVPEKHMGDAFHVWSAENAGLDCFLTCDGRFVNVWRHQKRVASALQVLLPAELLLRIQQPPSAAMH